ncbi:MAG: tRNA uridine-5-carboxymethylaminomethyl(34) synthesis GTPase MnmE, partial [Pseudomonadota bacterium]
STAQQHLGAAASALTNRLGPEFAAEDLRRAITELSALMGDIDVEEVLSAVFSEFCIGK